MPGLNYGKRGETPPYARIVRGLLYQFTDERQVVGGVNPSVPIDLPTGILARKNVTIQAEVFRSFLMRAGLYASDGVTYVGASEDNHALNSAANTHINSPAPTHSQASATPENVYERLIFDLHDGTIKIYSEGALVDTRAAPGGLGDVVPFLRTDSDSNAQVPGNSYLTKYRNVYVFADNDYHFRGLPPYGSVGITLSNGATLPLNVDGNGDMTFLGSGNGWGIPPAAADITFRIYTGPDLTGKLVGVVHVDQAFGGDVIGSTRVVLQPYPFTPKSIPRLLLWLRPEDIPVAGGNPMNTGWPDASGLTRNLIKAAGNNAPLKIDNAYNGRPVARFDGTSQLLYRDDATLRPPNFTLAVALAFSGATTGAKGLLSIAADGSQGLNINENGGGGAEAIYANDNTAGAYIPSTFGASPGMHILFVEVSAQTGRLRMFLDHALAPVVDIARGLGWPTEAPAFSLGTFYCGVGASAPALFAAGDIAEIVMYDKVLRDVDRLNLATYLTARWL